METGLDVGTLVQPALDAVQSGIGDVAGPALIVGGGILALSIGWRFAKRFVKG